MARNASVAEIDISKTASSADHQEHAPNQERHIAYAAGGQPHPSQAARNASVGLGEDDNIDFVDWDGPDDPENPFNWSTTYKWVATLTTCFISILTGLPAGAYGAASAQMMDEWNVDNQSFPFLSFALVTWNMGAAIFPLVFVPLTETTGRMPGYFVSLPHDISVSNSHLPGLIHILPHLAHPLSPIPPALSPNFATILVTRFFGGGASSVAINIVGGTITDIWKGDKQRSLPMSIFGMTSVVGIALGPFIGGAIQSGLNWRWIYWIQLIVDAGLLPFFWIILKETRGDVILAKRAAKLRKNGYPNAYARFEINKPGILQALKISFMRPTKMLATEFVVISFTIWVSFAWGILFLFQSSVAIVFAKLYAFNTFQISLIQLAICVGAVLATLINPLQDHLYLNSAKRNLERPGKPIPEARLYFAVPGSVIFGVGMIWYGWASYSSLHWIVPTLGLACVGIGVYSIYLAVVNYLADAYEKYAASALSAASMGRNVTGAFLPFATPAMYRTLGFHWASTLLGLIGLVLSIVPVILLVKGETIRAHSPFMLDATYEEEESVERRASLASR
ncbi:hypothetical protein M409DRAFT_68829 [Zasmidium cellare ATCC 36951]|uniref:Major facilitator superfamily (MFS) profile domain-containing protein n=1 Tax=Zasmidium cellare ATCC 36951 TaxID=1080233 RepID=A0A6A6CBI8_ZASCE|nr:uncharacterized protein M409DRAFT_68829 [Zasmidium cellare ATCC 36951]KAF2162836.1 hypothetical protein M409DRAFT_68829 [Zasmidium cellare ATCC 36951]